MKIKYRTVDELLEFVDEPNQAGCKRLLGDNRKLFQVVQGSTNNHQNWVGGYFDHIQEIMNIAFAQYKALSPLRPMPFSLSDLLLVVYLHDVEKPWKYELRTDGQLHHKAGMETKEDHQRFRIQKLSEYGIILTPDQENGLKYAEGELSDYSPRHRVMGPLACLAHVCDVLSARLWFGHPLEKNDPWEGSRRIRS